MNEEKELVKKNRDAKYTEEVSSQVDKRRLSGAKSDKGENTTRMPASNSEKSDSISHADIVARSIDLLMDVELDATLRFGAREMRLQEVLALGPGDVIELDRHVVDPVDLIVGDKIVARGEVVLVNGSFGLRVTEVSTPQLRLESIRCLF
jgi:flagellar motor switch protein FliN/FliY